MKLPTCNCYKLKFFSARNPVEISGTDSYYIWSSFKDADSTNYYSPRVFQNDLNAENADWADRYKYITIAGMNHELIAE